MEQPIIGAMGELRVLEFEYENHRRIVNPHALFREKRSGETVLLAWQTDGTSSKGSPPGWRNFRLNKIVDLTVREDTFPGAQADFKRDRLPNRIHAI